MDILSPQDAMRLRVKLAEGKSTNRRLKCFTSGREILSPRSYLFSVGARAPVILSFISHVTRAPLTIKQLPCCSNFSIADEPPLDVQSSMVARFSGRYLTRSSAGGVTV